MKTIQDFSGSLVSTRRPFIGTAAIVSFCVAALSACGGGGGGDSPGGPEPLAGTWSVQVEKPSGERVTTANVPASGVPTFDAPASAETRATAVASIFTAELEALGAVVARSGGRVTATGEGTNLTMEVDGFELANHVRCNPCNVGGAISFVANTTLSEEGVVRGYPYPRRSYQETYKFTYTRTQ